MAKIWKELTRLDQLFAKAKTQRETDVKYNTMQTLLTLPRGAVQWPLNSQNKSFYGNVIHFSSTDRSAGIIEVNKLRNFAFVNWIMRKVLGSLFFPIKKKTRTCLRVRNKGQSWNATYNQLWNAIPETKIPNPHFKLCQFDFQRGLTIQPEFD